jgi:hypothetical protein
MADDGDLADYEMFVSDMLLEISILTGIALGDRSSQHRDREAACGNRCLVCDEIDAARQSRNDRKAVRDE